MDSCRTFQSYISLKVWCLSHCPTVMSKRLGDKSPSINGSPGRWPSTSRSPSPSRRSVKSNSSQQAGNVMPNAHIGARDRRRSSTQERNKFNERMCRLFPGASVVEASEVSAPVAYGPCRTAGTGKSACLTGVCLNSILESGRHMPHQVMLSEELEMEAAASVPEISNMMPDSNDPRLMDIRVALNNQRKPIRTAQTIQIRRD